jgi:hypothetical protein
MRRPRDSEARALLAFDAPRVCAGVLATIGWLALGIELGFTISGALSKGAPLIPAMVRYFSFFTIETNLVLALILTASSLRPHEGGFLQRRGVGAAAVVYIIVVGAVYAILLAKLYHPSGLRLVADRILHVALPVLYPLYWLAFVEKGRIGWSHPLIWLSFPIAYLNYTLLRGAITDVYPYPFLDVAKLGYAKTLINALWLTAVFLGLGLLVTAIGHALAAQKSRAAARLAAPPISDTSSNSRCL